MSFKSRPSPFLLQIHAKGTNDRFVRMADARSLLRATRSFPPQDHQKAMAMVEAKLLG